MTEQRIMRGFREEGMGWCRRGPVFKGCQVLRRGARHKSAFSVQAS